MAYATAKRGLLLSLVILLASATGVRAEGPAIGAVQRLPVITISLQVGSTEKETRQVTYAPPPGWYVRSHVVTCTTKYGHSSFAVNTIPQNWNWSSEEQVHDSYKLLIDLAGEAQNAGLRARFAHERDRLLTELRKVQSTHHALVVEATAKGEGFLRGGGGLQLTVTAELVFLGTGEALTQTVAHHRERLR